MSQPLTPPRGKKFEIEEYDPAYKGDESKDAAEVEFAALYEDHWAVGVTANQKDAVYMPDDRFSLEIKTSSDAVGIFGNRSFGQQGGTGKKARDGYYIAVNFEKWSVNDAPSIRRVRWGWLDHTDWVAQASPTGQNSTLPTPVANRQLLTVYEG